MTWQMPRRRAVSQRVDMKQKLRKPNPGQCPKCGRSDAVVSIVYGYPTFETQQAADRGEISLAGCEVGDIDPRYTCRRCLISFDFEHPELATDKVAERGWVGDGGDAGQFEDV